MILKFHLFPVTGTHTMLGDGMQGAAKQNSR